MARKWWSVIEEKGFSFSKHGSIVAYLTLVWLKSKMNLNLSSQAQTAMMAVVDLNGVLRGKRLEGSYVTSALKNGIRMPLSIVGVDIWGSDIENSPQIFQTGDADGYFQHTGRGPYVQSWFEQPTNLIPAMMVNEDGTASGVCPRGALSKMEADYAAKGLRIIAATELEFHLIKRREGGSIEADGDGRLKNNAAIECIDAMQAREGFFKEVYETASQWEIDLGAALSEGSAGQYEINLSHQEGAVVVADNTYFMKRLIKGIAAKHGLEATFMAKPFGDGAGNGMHVHFSVLDKNGTNVFDDGGERGTQTLHHALGGLEAFMAAHMIIFGPHANSYRRFLAGSFAPTKVVWGYDNRLASLRVPASPPAARRIEHRVAGADANPYLVLAAIFGAALAGIDNAIAPSEPATGNAYEADRPELPLGWAQALDRFSSFPANHDLFDPRLMRMVRACKMQEQATFGAQISQFEYATYVDVV